MLFQSVDPAILTTFFIIAIFLALSIGVSLGRKQERSEYEKRLYLKYFPSGALDFKKKYWAHREALRELYGELIVYRKTIGNAVTERADEVLDRGASNLKATKEAIEAEYQRWYRAEGAALLRGFGEEIGKTIRRVDREFRDRYSDSAAAR